MLLASACHRNMSKSRESGAYTYPRLQTIPMRRGAVKTWSRAVSTWMLNAQQAESNFLSPKQRLRRAAARVPTPGARLRTRGPCKYNLYKNDGNFDRSLPCMHWGLN